VPSRVLITRAAEKALRKMPKRIATKLAAWKLAVETLGLVAVRQYPGYNDEALAGERAGQHSIRLSLAYRAFYTVTDGIVEIVTVIEINKHEY
jgi:proteic killer suppression protein